jgi:hypothetical protein
MATSETTKTELICSYPGCEVGTNLEHCANADGRLVCPAHRTIRDGHYECAICDAEVVEYAVAQEAQSRNHWLFWGTIFTFIASFFLFMSAGGSIGSIIIGLLVSGAAVFVMMRLGTFRRELIWLSGGQSLPLLLLCSSFSAWAQLLAAPWLGYSDYWGQAPQSSP